MAKVCLRMPLKNGGNAFRIFRVAMPGKPAWRLRKEAAEYPDDEGTRSADQHDPPPPLNMQRSARHKEPTQQSEYRDRRLNACKGQCKHASTEMAWNYLRRIGVERD